MSYYLLINLADDPDGPIMSGAQLSLHRGVQAKRTRKGFASLFLGANSIEQVSPFDLLDDHLQGKLSATNPKVVALREKCRRAKKIYLSTHGTPTDTDHSFKAAAGGTALCTAPQLAQFLLDLMPPRNDRYHLALIMCYGARTSTFRSTALNHQGANVPAQDLVTSFAYKLFKHICTQRNVLMTARTGAVGFDPKTGVSKVEQEVAIDARVDKETFLRQPHIIPTEQAYRDANIKWYQNRSDKKKAVDEWTELNSKFEQNPNLNPQNAVEKIVKEHHDIIRQKNGYQMVQDANPDLAKYGKFVYTYEQNSLRIVNKYGKPPQTPPNTVLYQGPLL